jgi:hypothetical protein
VVDRKAWLESVILGEEKEITTIKDPKTGDEYEVERAFPAAVRAKCLELLGKMSGDYVEKKDMTVTKEETVTFIQITNGRGPVPGLPSPAQLLAEDAEVYVDCTYCGEPILEKMHEDHESTCPER